MVPIFNLMAVLPLICFASAAEDVATCSSSKEASIGERGLLQVQTQRSVQNSSKRLAETVSHTQIVDPSGGRCPLPPAAQWCEVRLKNLPPYWMAVYNWHVKPDTVSWSVCDYGFWDQDDPSQFGVPGHMLDIGANIGYFSLMLAQGGWTVTSFEPMATNLAILAASLCQNPGLAARILPLPFGLGPNPQECKMVAPANNLGDGHVQCGTDFASGFSADPNSPAYIGNYNVQEIGSFSIRRLDQLLLEQAVTKVDFVKVDVEGYESQVLAGAPLFLSQYQPRLNKLEVWNASFGYSGTYFLNQYAAAGYMFFNDTACTVPMNAQQLVLAYGLWEGFACKVPGAR